MVVIAASVEMEGSEPISFFPQRTWDRMVVGKRINLARHQWNRTDVRGLLFL